MTPRSFAFRIPPQPGEQVAENNTQQALVDVRDGREKVLYIEGEPRHEMRFIRAAVEADSNLQVVALQRTAELTIDYAGRRVQFGQPIARFQAVQTHLARLASEAQRLAKQDTAELVARFGELGRRKFNLAA